MTTATISSPNHVMKKASYVLLHHQTQSYAIRSIATSSSPTAAFNNIRRRPCLVVLCRRRFSSSNSSSSSSSSSSSRSSSGNKEDGFWNQSSDTNKKRNIGTVATPTTATTTNLFENIKESTSYKKFDTSNIIIKNDDDDSNQKSLTLWQRVLRFPVGVKNLYYDCLRYKHIHDASKTRLNDWTINHPVRNRQKLKRTTNTNDTTSTNNNNDTIRQFFIYENELRPGKIPRRQYEQQRRARVDLRTMFPLVVLWIPPVIGQLSPLVAATIPRQILSRHFHNDYEIELFAQMEYMQRESTYIELGEMFWSSIHMNGKMAALSDMTIFQPDKEKKQTKEGKSSNNDNFQQREDIAGPMIDPMNIYLAFLDPNNSMLKTNREEQEKEVSNTTVPQGVKTSIDDLPREYLVKLSLAIGLYQHLPKWLSPWIAEWSPSFWLSMQIHRISRIVCHDDALLLEEGHDLNGCMNLTDIEVMDACLMRGLPIIKGGDVIERRQCLTNHLKMIASVKQQVHGPMCDGFRLFTMHMAPIRYNLKKKRNMS